jgi:hypothetical protein
LASKNHLIEVKLPPFNFKDKKLVKFLARMRQERQNEKRGEIMDKRNDQDSSLIEKFNDGRSGLGSAHLDTTIWNEGIDVSFIELFEAENKKED